MTQEPFIACEVPVLVCPRVPSGATITGVFAATLGALLIVGFIEGPHRPHGGHGESKVDIAKLRMQQYANEAYPLWSREHPREECPASVRDLDRYMKRYMDKAAREDPWGREYRFTCGGGRLYVVSLGEDGKASTADDIWSHQ